MADDRSAEVGHCCVPGCGKPDVRGLCRGCRLRYSTDGQLPAWLRELQRDQQARTKREQRRRRRGISVESLDQLAACI